MRTADSTTAPQLHRPDVPPSMNIAHLRKSLLRSRTLMSLMCSLITFALVLIAVVPLFSVLYMLCWKGAQTIDWAFFTETSPYALQETGGGVGNSIVGSLTMVLIATLISVPVSVLTAVYLSEISPDSKFAGLVRFASKLLTGLPSIIAGVFIFGLMVATMKTFSAWAGGVALSILMIPMITLTAEEAIKMVPAKMREAAYGMGCTKTQVIYRVLVPTALPGILTGIMLAIARALGETAPLLFTAQYAPQSWVWEGKNLRLDKPTQSLAVFVYENAGSVYDNLDEMAWGAALVLVVLVLVFNVGGQLISYRAARHKA